MIERTEAEIMKNWTSKDVLKDGVCIRCLAYNHEKYIAQCLDGFLMQETTFPFKVVIHDDASTDNTAAVIKEYELKYPGIITALYEEENLYQKSPLKLIVLMRNNSRAKYIAVCEGDDFWTDPQKLQLQYEALEAHPECAASTCLVKSCNEDGSPNESVFPNKKYNLDKTGIIDHNELIKMLCPGYPFHTSGYFIRDEAFYYHVPGVTDYFKRDVGTLLRVSLFGDVYYIDRPMSMRRYGAKDGWNTMIKKQGKKGIFKLSVDNYLMFFNYDKLTEGRYRDTIFPYMTSVIGNVMNYDRKKSVELEKQYIDLVGEEEYKKRFDEVVRGYPAVSRFKYKTFKNAPLLYDVFSGVWHLFKKTF